MTRCFICNKKLNLIEQISGVCKCNRIFCHRHRTLQLDTSDDKSHSCSVESIKQNHKKKLEILNPKILISKISQI